MKQATVPLFQWQRKVTHPGLPAVPVPILGVPAELMAPQAGLVRAERGMSASPSALCCLATRLHAQPASAGDSRLWGLQGGALSTRGEGQEALSTWEGLRCDLTDVGLPRGYLHGSKVTGDLENNN